MARVHQLRDLYNMCLCAGMLNVITIHYFFNECIKVLISNHATAHTKAGLKIILLTSTFVIYEVISKTEAHNLIMPKTTFFTEK